MKILGFIINTNLLIALAAVSLAMATGVQLGIYHEFRAYLPVIFFATWLDYNLHRFVEVYKNQDALHIEKLHWAATHSILLVTLILVSTTGLITSVCFASASLLYVLIPLALLSFFYSAPLARMKKRQSWLLAIPGMKTVVLAFVWTSASVFLPIIKSGIQIDTYSLALLFIERFTFIFAIAIPFDIRDHKADSLAGIRTIPGVFGERRAIFISNSAMLASLAVAFIHYFPQGFTLVLAAYTLTVSLAIYFINNQKLKIQPWYYHGILDGCILFHGALLSTAFLFNL